MTRTSDWYASLGEYSFPTTFLLLSPEEQQALGQGDIDSAVARSVAPRLQTAIRHLTGSCFVACDVCAPIDSPRYRHGRWTSFGRSAWRLLATSDRVRTAVRSGGIDLLVVRPFRRMDRSREFRMFFRGRELTAVSQYWLDRHYPGIVKRSGDVWRCARQLAGQIVSRLPQADQAVDVYLTSSGRMMIIDINPWGDPTDPLLFRTWERDWDAERGVRLLPSPVKMKGDVSVSF